MFWIHLKNIKIKAFKVHFFFFSKVVKRVSKLQYPCLNSNFKFWNYFQNYQAFKSFESKFSTESILYETTKWKRSSQSNLKVNRLMEWVKLFLFFNRSKAFRCDVVYMCLNIYLICRFDSVEMMWHWLGHCVLDLMLNLFFCHSQTMKILRIFHPYHMRNSVLSCSLPFSLFLVSSFLLYDYFDSQINVFF